MSQRNIGVYILFKADTAQAKAGAVEVENAVDRVTTATDRQVDASGRITDYKLRQKDPKRQSVIAFQSLNYRCIAAGDSYNDTTMLAQAEAGILFKAPQNVIAEFPQFPAVSTYDALKLEFLKASNRDLKL